MATVTRLAPTITTIRATRGWVKIDVAELWEHRELLYFLVWRDIKVRYKRTIIGALWAIIQPLTTMVVFSFVFGRLANVPSDGVPYPLFSFAALVPWMFFSNSLAATTQSVISNARMLTKVYFPRLFLPLASVGSSAVDFVIALSVLFLMMIYFRSAPTAAIGLLPLFCLLTVALAVAVGLWLAALNALYQDVRYAVPFLLQLWLYASPVAYPSSLVPASVRPYYGLNPMAGVIEGFRWTLIGGPQPSSTMLGVSIGTTLVLLVTGVLYFRRVERTFADVV